MANAINGNIALYSNQSRSSNIKKVVLSDELKEYLENSGSQGGKLSKEINNLFRSSDKLSALISSDTSNEAVSLYKSGSSDVKNFIKTYNKVVKYIKNASDDAELANLTKKIKKYAKKDSSELAKLGINVKGSGTLEISDETAFKNALASGKMGSYLKKQSQSKNSFLSTIQSMAKKLYHDNTSYLSDKTNADILAYNKKLPSASSNNSSSVSNFSFYA